LVVLDSDVEWAAGSSEPALSGVPPAGAGGAMRACAIQARSSRAGSPGQRGGPVVQTTAPDPGRRDERGREAIACGRWDIRGQAFEQR
jgi:hypothetical protein